MLFHGTVTFNELRMEVVKCNFVEITPILGIDDDGRHTKLATN